ncbi:Alpha/beta hydrolase-1 [Heracleum sosnowskyi]|uniref:Alpha/beta hydrolase-1 n=1 Tax=Heracleum sosnowskyi TaxID=360622 RepID=A0AAD8JG72_9APIA|nr:Alpha/beta hydrolase-1 [Heracleum sosnowskyi]
MEKVEHKYIQVNGSGSTTILAIAIDFRGYGLSDPKAEPEKTTYADILSDLLVLLDALCLDKVVLIAKDFGARPAYLFTLLHPTRVSGVITLGGVFTPPSPPKFLKDLPEGLYINRWQVPGRAEADFGRFDAKTVVRKIYILFSKSELPIAAENQEIMDMVEPSTPLPPWFTKKDLDIYGSLYERSGFRTEEYIRSGKVKHFAPNYEITFLPEGTHFVHEQLPDQVNQLILTFLGKHNL